MRTDLLSQGLVIGLSIAVPVGPIGVLCIRRTISEGRLRGLVTGLGAALGDATYGGVAAFGLTLISGFLVEQQFWFRLIGGLFLVYLGVKTFSARLSEGVQSVNDGGLVSVFVSTFFLTLTNPLTILMFTAVFAGFGVAPDVFGDAALVTLGVFIGSASWWVALTIFVGFLSSYFSAWLLRAVNVVSGLLIAGFGVYSIFIVLS